MISILLIITVLYLQQTMYMASEANHMASDYIPYFVADGTFSTPFDMLSRRQAQLVLAGYKAAVENGMEGFSSDHVILSRSPKEHEDMIFLTKLAGYRAFEQVPASKSQ